MGAGVPMKGIPAITRLVKLEPVPLSSNAPSLFTLVVLTAVTAEAVTRPESRLSDATVELLVATFRALEALVLVTPVESNGGSETDADVPVFETPTCAVPHCVLIITGAVLPTVTTLPTVA